MKVGGVSVHTGTIPSKTLRETALNLSGWRERGFYGQSYRVKKEIGSEDLGIRLAKTLAYEVDVLEHQFQRNGVSTMAGFARFVDPHQLVVTQPDGSEMLVHGDRILIAVGTVPFRPDFVDFSDPDVMDSDEIVDIHRLPRSLTVIGAGVIGIEYATIFSALDVAVTIVEPRDSFLDFVDREIIEEFIHELRDRGVTFRTGSKVVSVARQKDGPVTTELADGRLIRSEMVLYAAGRKGAVEDLGLVAERAQRYRALGHTAQKWFFRHGPMSGHEGLMKNVALVRTVREAVGDDCDLMFDCWQSFNLDYAVDLAGRIAEYRPRWLEECFMPDRIDSHVKLKAKTNIPLSGAEHEYTRWGFKRFIEKDALDVLQPDIYWAGGLSEVLKIAAYATVHDLIVIPHGHSSPATIHFSVTQSPIHTPYQEFLVKWNAIHVHFLKHPVEPQHGPGLGMRLDADKIEKEEEVRF